MVRGCVGWAGLPLRAAPYGPQTPKQLFGVLGIDIVPADMLTKADWNTTLKAMYDETFECPVFAMDEAHMEKLRTRLGGMNCADASRGAAAEATTDVGAIVGGAVGGLVALAIFMKCCRYKKNKQPETPKDISHFATHPPQPAIQLAPMHPAPQAGVPVASQVFHGTVVQAAVVTKSPPGYSA